MIDNSCNVSVKKQKLSNDVEETNNILAPTEPKRRTDQVRPAILSQPSVDDGDNPECTQQQYVKLVDVDLRDMNRESSNSINNNTKKEEEEEEIHTHY